MKTVHTATELRETLDALTAQHDLSIGFVPTMGALHEGHLSLIHAARQAHELVVLSIFVNPKQFEDGGDFSSYPRDEARDLELARGAGVDVVFMPDASEMYPPGFTTSVQLGPELTSVLEGAVRGSEHFSGMATVVCKLLLAVRPAAAYFGEKDFQQLVVVRRVARDLGLPVRIIGCPTLREADGLALSSRNVRLTTDERRRAAAIPRALTGAAAAVRQGETDVTVLRSRALQVLDEAGLDCEYLAFVNPDTLEAVTSIAAPTVCAVAVSTASTRLIDNQLLTPPVFEGSTDVC